MFVMRVIKNVSAVVLTIVRDTHKLVASVLKNVEEWQDKKITTSSATTVEPDL
jgi:hypothetical protein